MGISLGLIYANFYDGGDTFHYFQDAKALRILAMEEPLAYLRFLFNNDIQDNFKDVLVFSDFSPRAMFFSKIVSIINLVTLDHYYLTSLFFSSFSTIAFFYLADTLSRL
ncbi:MAG: hypothetical protein OEY51_00585, partial [Cyclobacteriaceae bacterium]|nr:hypothetical protein [Cyclobacteriaceae bacterium]